MLETDELKWVIGLAPVLSGMLAIPLVYKPVQKLRQLPYPILNLYFQQNGVVLG